MSDGFIFFRIKKGKAEDKTEKRDVSSLFAKLGCPYDLLLIVKEVNTVLNHCINTLGGVGPGGHD